MLESRQTWSFVLLMRIARACCSADSSLPCHYLVSVITFATAPAASVLDWPRLMVYFSRPSFLIPLLRSDLNCKWPLLLKTATAVEQSSHEAERFVRLRASTSTFASSAFACKCSAKQPIWVPLCYSTFLSVIAFEQSKASDWKCQFECWCSWI